MSPSRPLRRGTLAAAALALLMLLPLAVHADQPLWELGLGVGALRVPHYRGSDQSHDWLLPIPYLVYRGQIFRSDREGTRAVLLDSERLDLDLSLAGSPPTRNGDDRARSGMPDLAATLGLGPNLNLRLAKGAYWKLDLRVPLRAEFTLGSGARSIGWTGSPLLNLDLSAQGWNIGLQGSLQAATRRYHAYFYDVAPAYASAGRPAYAAPGGAAGWDVTASASRRLGDWWVAAYARLDSLAGARFDASPLVRQRQNTSFGLAASWVFKTSQTRVADAR